jgi:hypothetical protein
MIEDVELRYLTESNLLWKEINKNSQELIKIIIKQINTN